MMMSFIHKTIILATISVLCCIGVSHQTDWRNGNWAMWCDFPGNDFKKMFDPDVQCFNYCIATPGCTHFSWNQGVCYMKSGGMSKDRAIYKKDVICGINPNQSNYIAWRDKWTMDCDFPGNDLKKEYLPIEQCFNRCGTTQGCTHFAWSNGVCYMKSGSMDRKDAIPRKGVICGVLSVSSKPPSDEEVSFTIINRCLFQIWPAIQGMSRSDPSWRLPFNGGWALGPGQFTTFSVPRDLSASRVWARTNCRDFGNIFRCDTGDCGPSVDCAGRGGQAPATLAEFTLYSADFKDFYGVSFVDGFNIKLSIIPKTPNYQESQKNWCSRIDSSQDLTLICPYELRKYNPAGQVVGCMSACRNTGYDIIFC